MVGRGAGAEAEAPTTSAADADTRAGTKSTPQVTLKTIAVTVARAGEIVETPGGVAVAVAAGPRAAGGHTLTRGTLVKRGEIKFIVADGAHRLFVATTESDALRRETKTAMTLPAATVTIADDFDMKRETARRGEVPDAFRIHRDDGDLTDCTPTLPRLKICGCIGIASSFLFISSACAWRRDTVQCALQAGQRFILDDDAAWDAMNWTSSSSFLSLFV